MKTELFYSTQLRLVLIDRQCMFDFAKLSSKNKHFKNVLKNSQVQIFIEKKLILKGF